MMTQTTERARTTRTTRPLPGGAMALAVVALMLAALLMWRCGASEVELRGQVQPLGIDLPAGLREYVRR